MAVEKRIGSFLLPCGHYLGVVRTSRKTLEDLSAVRMGHTFGERAHQAESQTESYSARSARQSAPTEQFVLAQRETDRVDGRHNLTHYDPV
jgi:hypothetical protein